MMSLSSLLSLSCHYVIVILVIVTVILSLLSVSLQALRIARAEQTHRKFSEQWALQALEIEITDQLNGRASAGSHLVSATIFLARLQKRLAHLSA